MTTEQIARQILAANGCTDPHPALVEDTMREVEYHGATAPAGDVYEVVRDEFPVPCSHPACALLHKRYHEGSEWSYETAELPNGELRRVRVQGVHEATRTQWLVLRNGVRVDDAEPRDTKREAMAELARVRGVRVS